MLLQAALNGNRTPSEHPNVPVAPEQIVVEVRRVIEAGADTVHFHVRQTDGSQSLMPEDVSRTLSMVRAVCPDVALGISTSVSIVPDSKLRHQLVSQWTVLPDYVSVNIHEEGSLELIELLLSKGIGIEAGVWNSAAAQQLLSSGLVDDCLRILIEATEDDVSDARANVQAVQAVFKAAHLKTPCLLHGENAPAWTIFEDAITQGYDTRVGFEDMLTLPDGTAVESNAALIQFAFDHMQATKQ